MIDRALEHLGAERATRYLRKFYPWYVERLGGYSAGGPKALQAALQTAAELEAARARLDGVAARGVVALLRRDRHRYARRCQRALDRGH